MPPDGTATIAQSPEDLRASVKAQIVEGKPTLFATQFGQSSVGHVQLAPRFGWHLPG
jgi:hypothetical protein